MIAQSDDVIFADPDDWRAYFAALDEAAQLALFRVGPRSTVFRCPTNGRRYIDESARTIDGARWARCWWCDTHGRVHFQDVDYDDRARQPHGYAIGGDSE